jgi:hypothetical protein
MSPSPLITTPVPEMGDRSLYFVVQNIFTIVFLESVFIFSKSGGIYGVVVATTIFVVF